MRLRQIDIERFGIWRDWSSGELPAGLAVFFGPNETGKSTLLEFLRGMFFGFHRRSGFAPPDDPVLAGRLVCEHQEAVFNLSRRWTPSRGDVVEVFNESRNSPAEEVVRLLCPLDETTFNAIFAVNLEDIAHLRTLEAAATSELLYDLSLGIDRAILGRVFARLQEEADVPRQSELLQGLLEERDRLQRELQEAPAAGAQFARLLTARKTTEQQCAKAEEALTQWREKAQAWESLRQLLPLWEERCRVERELRELGALTDVPAVFFRRVAHLRERYRVAKEKWEHLKEQYSQVKARLGKITINQALLSYATELEALRPIRNDLSTLQTTLNSLQAEQDRLAEELTNLRSRFGVDTLESPRNFPWGDVRRGIAQWERIGQRVRTEEEKIAGDRAAKDRLEEQLRRKLETFHAPSVPTALEERSRQATHLRKLAQFREQLASVENRQKELRTERLDVMKETLLTGRTWLFVAVPFVLGLALVLLSLMMLAIFPVSSLGWGGVLVGAILVGAGVAVKLHGERLHRSRADAILQEWETLRVERERLVEQIACLETAITAAPAYLPRELAALENEIRELESLGLLQSQLDQLTQRIAEEERKLSELRAQLGDAANRVATFLAQQGLPASEDPESARNALETLRQYRRVHLRWESVNKRLLSLVRQRETWSARLQQIAQRAGIQTPDTSLELVLDTLLAAYDEAVARARE
uniref:AAA family ATPase n=1 Tax=Thermogutta sp. TaxID=1962930 RepID=UPI00321FA5F8